MKRILSFLMALSIFSIGALTFVGCKDKTSSSTIRLNEVTHSVFYAPLYLAINLGYFEEEDIKIELTNGGGSDVSMAALLSKTADIALLGPETIVYVAAQNSSNHPMIFGQLTKRDGSFLISRTNETDFEWRNLEGKTVITGRSGGLPAMTFQYVANGLGLYDGDNITLNDNVAFNMIGPTFEGGSGDYCTLFEPTASEYQSAGKGYIVASVGAYSGEIPYTCFMAMPSYIQKHPEKITGFLRAISKAYAYLMTNTNTVVAQALKPSFDATSIASLEYAVAAYKAIDAWMATPVMTSLSFEKLLEVLQNAGEDTGDVEFDDVVDNSFALSLI